MRDYELTLSSKVKNTYYVQRAADSVDLDVAKKLTHHMRVRADVESAFNVAVIVGNSGSGKSTLARHIWGTDWERTLLDPTQSVIDQFPDSMSYDQRVDLLCAAGLTAPVCWIQPAGTLSNGQQARAEVALQLASDRECVIIDEWTSVVDRDVAKVMSHSVQKLARRLNKQVVLLSCHRDIVEWIDPDWIIDCDRQEYTDRRSLCRRSPRSTQLVFRTHRLNSTRSWSGFSRYHYLTERLPGGHQLCYGLFLGEQQIGFILYSNYVAHTRKRREQGLPMMMHANRIVIHPDYCGFGLGSRFLNETAQDVLNQGYDVRIKLSSRSLSKQLLRDRSWQIKSVRRNIFNVWQGSGLGERQGRQYVKTYCFKYLGAAQHSALDR